MKIFFFTVEIFDIKLKVKDNMQCLKKVNLHITLH